MNIEKISHNEDIFDLHTAREVVRRLLFIENDLLGAQAFLRQAYENIRQSLKQEKWSVEVRKTYENAIKFFRVWANQMPELKSKFGIEAVDNLKKELKDNQNSLKLEMEGKIIDTAGAEVRHAYDILLIEYPDLHNLNIKSKTVQENDVLSSTGGYFEDPNTFDNEISIVIVTDNVGIKHYEEILKKRKASVEQAAEMLNIAPEQMTPKLLRLFIFLHEFGHAHDYIINYAKKENGPTLWNERKAKQTASLPIPILVPPALRLKIEQNQIEDLPLEAQELIKKGGAEEVLHRQDLAYRNLPKERYADQFAVDFIARHNILAQM